LDSGAVAGSSGAFVAISSTTVGSSPSPAPGVVAHPAQSNDERSSSRNGRTRISGGGKTAFYVTRPPGIVTAFAARAAPV
jgi:hypothetical protein